MGGLGVLGCRCQARGPHRAWGACGPLRGGTGAWEPAGGEGSTRGNYSGAPHRAWRETFTSASRSSFCQSHTDSTWSLESSTAHRLLPPFCGGKKGIPRKTTFENKTG